MVGTGLYNPLECSKVHFRHPTLFGPSKNHMNSRFFWRVTSNYLPPHASPTRKKKSSRHPFPSNPLGIPDVSWQGFGFLWVNKKQQKTSQICPKQGTFTKLEFACWMFGIRKTYIPPNGGISYGTMKTNPSKRARRSGISKNVYQKGCLVGGFSPAHLRKRMCKSNWIISTK